MDAWSRDVELTLADLQKRLARFEAMFPAEAPQQVKTDRRRKDFGPSTTTIVRYDFDSKRWIHSAGVVLTPTESKVLAAMVSAEASPVLGKATCLDRRSVDRVVGLLKRRFRVSTRAALVVIAQQLFS